LNGVLNGVGLAKIVQPRSRMLQPGQPPQWQIVSVEVRGTHPSQKHAEDGPAASLTNNIKAAHETPIVCVKHSFKLGNKLFAVLYVGTKFDVNHFMEKT